MMVKDEAIAHGADSNSIERYLADFKKRTDLIEAHEIVAVPCDLQDDLLKEYTKELPNEVKYFGSVQSKFIPVSFC